MFMLEHRRWHNIEANGKPPQLFVEANWGTIMCTKGESKLFSGVGVHRGENQHPKKVKSVYCF